MEAGFPMVGDTLGAGQLRIMYTESLWDGETDPG